MKKGRRLFCQLSPTAYRISVVKGCALRLMRDALFRTRFAKERSKMALPAVVYRHNSLIRRTLGVADPLLQENKAVNLAIAAPKISHILIRPGETFSFWQLAGRCTAKKSYKEGMVIENGQVGRGIGGGLCQFTNLIHWIVLHTPLTIVEHHHHDAVDLFPDFGRQVPFGTGTSIFYNYVDYRFRNDTDLTFQLVVWVDEKYLCGELRADRLPSVKYHVAVQDEAFVQETDGFYRTGKIYRRAIDRDTGNMVSCELLKENHARVMYTLDTQNGVVSKQPSVLK